ncbi:MAG: type II toxin-antitoxin system VapC family toxin [Bryobacteraceae bacterium]|jgi:predicted nucleic acid-binding protein
MTAFVDTSVFLRRLLKQPGAFTDWSAWGSVASSELLRVESRRVLDRLRLQRALDDDELGELNRLLQAAFRALDFVRLSRAVLQRAADPFPTALGTLDAIHLASALLWMEEKGGEMTFLTHDAQLAIAARACGLDVQTNP